MEYLSGLAWIVCAMIDLNSVIVSRFDMIALATARKRHELSSGMIRKTKLPPRSGMKISGGSDISLFSFLDSDKGADEGFCIFGSFACPEDAKGKLSSPEEPAAKIGVPFSAPENSNV